VSAGIAKFAAAMYLSVGRSMSEVSIVPATSVHSEGIWTIFQETVTAGETYVFPSDTCREDALAYWSSESHHPFVALDDRCVLGTYFLRPNHVGRGSHVANASYMVLAKARGKGIGSLMCEHSLEEARRLGFSAMQFNLVVSTNDLAVRLWKRHGFRIVGTLPRVFRHPTKGLVDAFVMHRFL
jgi:L-amino acid N-acyltransferase YncA